jgi:hypothetical protein
MSFDETFDVVVVGGGNAGFSSATTAAQLGSRVLLVEKAPQSDAGGNTFFTAGAYRTCFGGLEDLLPIIFNEDGTKGLPRELVERIDMEPYTPADFHADIKRVCKGRADPALANVLVDGSRDAVQWIADLGGKWRLSFNRQAFEVNGRFRFWGGMVMAFLGEDLCSFLWGFGLRTWQEVVRSFSTGMPGSRKSTVWRYIGAHLRLHCAKTRRRDVSKALRLSEEAGEYV